MSTVGTTKGDLEALLHRAADRCSELPAGEKLSALSATVLDIAFEAEREVESPAWRDEAALQLQQALEAAQ